MTDPDEPANDLDDSAPDGGVDATDDDGNRDDPAPSVIQRIGKIIGAEPQVSLREVDSAVQAQMVNPLTASDGVVQRTGKYTVHGMLGQGGVGAVHKGHDTDLGRDVAMKFLHEKYKGESTILHRFVEEAQIGGQLQHPGIVPVYELGMSDGRPFFTMKMVKGQTLAQKLKDRPSPGSHRRTFLAIFEDICQTIAYAHARGVVHRDLKPANIMIGSFGEVQVVDWGMGKVLQRDDGADDKSAASREPQPSVIETVRSTGEGSQSVVGSVMGTIAYMPPEQARGDVEAMDARSDVFALGAILCEILTGQPPYVGEPSELLAMAAMATLDDAHARLAASGAQDDLVELATACLMPAPAARPQSAETVAKAVHDHLAAAEQRVHDATIRALALKRTQKLGIALTSVIAMGLAASLWFWQGAKQAAASESEARGLAEQSAEDARAAELVARQTQAVAEANLASFNRLSHVVRLESAKAKEQDLYPAWPEKTESIRSWLNTDVKGLTSALPELQATLEELEVKALPTTDAERAASRRTHPRAGELKELKNKITALQYARDVRTGALQPESFPVAQMKLPRPLGDLTHGELKNLVWTRVHPKRKVFGREAEGLALARRAVIVAPATGDDRAMVADALAWALFANGLDAEALTSSKAALAAASEKKQDEYAANLIELNTAIDGATGDESARTLESLRVQAATLDAAVSARATWRFADDADRFLHSTLRDLLIDMENFERNEVVAVKQRLLWSEQVEELTIERYREGWNNARLAILKADGVTASKLYGEVSIELQPQLGLVPIGMNPVTKLWEFYHLRSAWDGLSDPAAIAVPVHRRDGSIHVEGHTGIVFVLLPGGTYTMGAQSSDPTAPSYDADARFAETPHQVTLSPFLLARHELTQGQWARLWSGDESMRWPSSYGLGFRAENTESSVTAAHPVEQVDWSTSDELLGRHGLVLPTEAQWEYGCRGNTSTPYWCAVADLKKFANVSDATATSAGLSWASEAWADGHVVHSPVGAFGANGFGLCDVHGNLWEWCRDFVGDYGSERAGDGLREQATSSNRINRGGSFSDPALSARAAVRDDYAPTVRGDYLGLRPARALLLRD